MNEDVWFLSACKGKQSFNAERAKRVAKAVRKHRAKKKIVAYRCAVCRKWHIGGVRRGSV